MSANENHPASRTGPAADASGRNDSSNPPTTLVQATFDIKGNEPDENRLDLKPSSVAIAAGTSVTWEFEGVPEGYHPVVRFVSDPPGSVFGTGPFESLCFTAERIVGSGDSGRRGTVPESGYTYEVALIPQTAAGTQVLSFETPGTVKPYQMMVDSKDEDPDTGEGPQDNLPTPADP